MLYCNTATVAATRPLGRCDTALGARAAGRTGAGRTSARRWADRALGAGARGRRAAGGRERADAWARGERGARGVRGSGRQGVRLGARCARDTARPPTTRPRARGLCAQAGPVGPGWGFVHSDSVFGPGSTQYFS